MPLLVTLGQQLLASSPAPSAPESTGHLLHLIAKAYKISIVADLSPHQASQESIVQWGTFLLQIVCRVIPNEAQPEDKDDRERWSWWKAKKWAHHVVCCTTCKTCDYSLTREIAFLKILDVFPHSSIAYTIHTVRPHNSLATGLASSNLLKISKLTSHLKF